MTWTSGVVHAGDIDVHYLRTGRAKPPLVLLHGLTGSGACWAPVARALECEYDVVMPDARGHGRSSTPRDGYAYEDHGSDVVGLRPPDPEYHELVAGLRVPILLVTGDSRAIVSVETARALQRLNSGVRIEQISGAGHAVPYDQPERLASVVSSFLRSMTAP